MKRTSLAVLLAALTCLAGCQWLQSGWGSSGGSGKPDKSKSGGQSETVGKGGAKGLVQVYIVQGTDSRPVFMTVNIAGRPSVLEVTRVVTSVKTELSPTGAERVVSVAGVANDPAAGKVWVFELNGMTQSNSPNVVYVGHGDVVRWRLQ